MPTSDIRAELLNRASECLGGEERLQRFLGVSPAMLRRWTAGRSPVPDHLLLRVIDLLQDGASTMPAFGDVEGYGDSPFWSGGFLAEGDAQSVLDMALSAAMQIARAPMGNIQLFRSGTLRIESQRGFSRDFLDFFASVQADDGCCCGAAAGSRSRITVADVRASPVFAEGSEEQAAMLGARSISVQSTPIFSRGGTLLAVFSTHDEVPRDHSAGCAEALDAVGQRLGDWLAWRAGLQAQGCERVAGRAPARTPRSAPRSGA